MTTDRRRSARRHVALRRSMGTCVSRPQGCVTVRRRNSTEMGGKQWRRKRRVKNRISSLKSIDEANRSEQNGDDLQSCYSNPAFRIPGGIDEAWFDSVGVMEFDCEDDYHSVQEGIQLYSELSKELEQWNELLRSDIVKLCQENNFNTCFFEGSDNNIVVDVYEFKGCICRRWEKQGKKDDRSDQPLPAMFLLHLQ